MCKKFRAEHDSILSFFSVMDNDSLIETRESSVSVKERAAEIERKEKK